MSTMKSLFVFSSILLVCLCSCEQPKQQEADNTIVAAVSEKQKAENNLFLSFYHGMTLEDFKSEELKLFKTGYLIKYDSTDTAINSDTTTKFLLVIHNNGLEKCFFTLVPSFEDDSLNSIELNYIPAYGKIATFRTSSIGSTNYKTKQVPDITTANVIERIYTEKYGKPIIKKGFSLEGFKHCKWLENNKEINLYNEFKISHDMNGKNYRQISGIAVEYRSKKFDMKAKAEQGSIDSIRAKHLSERAKLSKESI